MDMKKIVLLLLLFALGSTAALGQAPPHRGNIDVALGVGPGAFSGALSWYRLHPVALKKRFYLGYGLRFTAFVGNDRAYVTAPANVSEGNLFKKQNEAKLDTLVLPHSNTNALNAAIYLGYAFSDKFNLGFNIDAIGFTFGPSETGTFQAASQDLSSPTEPASVTPFNLLLTGDYDRGSLNSEFFAMYRFHEKWAVRGGATFIFSEYTTERLLAFGNDRFRTKSLGVMVALSHRL